jgi:hypothetical protein
MLAVALPTAAAALSHPRTLLHHHAAAATRHRSQVRTGPPGKTYLGAIDLVAGESFGQTHGEILGVDTITG